MGNKRNKKKARKGAAMATVEGAGGVQGNETRGRRPGRPRKLRLTPEEAAVAAIVLGNDDLLREILLRLGFPTSLVRAALVCKRWLRVTSDPAFLSRFRELHPPRLLASYPIPIFICPKIVPPQGLPPELAAVVHRARTYFPRLEQYRCSDSFNILDWCNGRVLVGVEDITTRFRRRVAVCSPLLPVGDFAFLPRCPLALPQGYTMSDMYEFLPEDGGDAMSYYVVRLVYANNRRVVLAQAASLQARAWDDSRTSASMELPEPWLRCKNSGLLVSARFYMLGQKGYILGLDLVSMSLFFINLPDGLKHNYHGFLDLSRADDSKFYLIHVKGLQLRIWLHDMNIGDETSNWVLIDTICLLEMFGHLAKPGWGSGGSSGVLIARGGDNAEFVYLGVDDEFYLMHIKRRTVEKVFENGVKLTCQNFCIHPFMMVWPPTFPALSNGHDQDE